MMVDSKGFGSRNVLRTLGDAKIGWDEVGWGLVVAPTKTRERKLGFELLYLKI